MKLTKQELLAEIARLQQRLGEAEETLEALRSGAVDALVVSFPEGEKVYTLKGADYTYRHLIENINEGAATLTSEGDILYANGRLAQILGLPLEQVIGTSMRGYIAGVNQELFNALFAQAENGESKGEVPLKTGAGLAPAYLSFSSLKLEDAPGALSLVVTDLTQQKRQEALVADGKLSQEILLQAEQPIAVCDKSGVIIRASRGLHQLCHQNPLLLPFRLAFPLKLPGNQPFLLAPLIQGNILNNVEATFPRPDGRQVHVLLNAGPLLAEGTDDIKGFVVAFTDITERQEAAQEKARLEAQLFQTHKLEAIGALAGGIAHEFNNILWVILGYTEMTLMSIPENSQERFNLEQVMQAGGRARDLVNQILAFSRKSVKDRKPLCLSMIIKEALRFLRATLPTTIDIQQHIEATGAMVLADVTQLHQVLMNLCNNAAHAMKEMGGILKAGIEELVVDESNLPQYPALTPGPYIVLSLSDTGPGIEPNLLPRIFEPFFTTKGVGEGSGMGLAVVHGIVKSHGGEITVTSQVGLGSTFTVFLPIVAGAEKLAPDVCSPIPTGTSRILCVEDEPMLADLIKAELGILGYDVTARNSSLEALELFQTRPEQFNLVITDQTMPYLTGLQLAQKLKCLRPDIPIIICSGYSDKVSEEEIKEVGVKKFLMKPVDLRQLAQAVREVLDESG